ncbi:hypothetical protein [Bacillus pseudomycoides]|uniref:hypothetical protein n=1 Tax=Bacillus pseudomycoides TaxID=64104 RepID=UPI003CF04172
MKINSKESILDHWKFNLSVYLSTDSGIVFFVSDLYREYEKFYDSTNHFGSTDFSPCNLHYSGDGYRAFLWIESYLELMKENEHMPRFVDIVCWDNYEDELKMMFGRCYSISEDSYLLKALGKEPIRRDNAKYIIEALDKMKNFLKSKGISFRQIKFRDMKVKV